jgi:hypothetical protein
MKVISFSMELAYGADNFEMAPKVLENLGTPVVKGRNLSVLRTPRKYSWYSFLLEAESTPRPECSRKDYSINIGVIPSNTAIIYGQLFY